MKRIAMSFGWNYVYLIYIYKSSYKNYEPFISKYYVNKLAKCSILKPLLEVDVT